MQKKITKLIDYQESTAEDLIQKSSEKYDVVTCLEVLEHVPDPKLLVKTCIDLLKPNGDLFLSTINKNPRSWLTAIVGAEYIFNILPKGTHEFDKFIKPSSLGSYS
jgi:2-polyprenyl-6-hydroxyphenyl methylase/3-demethylubiquinone-9 3-methyltransferase